MAIPFHLPASISVLTGTHQLFLMLIVLCIFLYGLSVGKMRAIISLLAIYAAFALTATFPYAGLLEKELPKISDGFTKASLFLILYVLVSLVLNLASLKNRLSLGELSFFKVCIISVFQVTLLGSIMLFFIPQAAIPKQIGYIYPYMGTQTAVFLWLLAGLIILPFMRHGREK